jgi:hypothetical protein
MMMEGGKIQEKEKNKGEEGKGNEGETRNKEAERTLVCSLSPLLDPSAKKKNHSSIYCLLHNDL